ncbi:MAG TPA: transglutaminase domain-containing protein [Acidobacteriota bacterium]|nr:transglutaminase domain-containing protein [Acidobacteriota bacterium]
MIVGGLIICMPLNFAASAQQVQQIDAEPDIRWPVAEVNTLRTFFERVDVEEVMVGLAAPRGTTGAAEIAALSAILPPGLEAPFRFVQRRVRHEPYVGNVRGARGALLAASGNSLDQTLLLADLYRARGRPVRLVRGRLAWRDAVALVGEPAAVHIGHGDPWLRWIEMAADHWWLEVRRGERWTSMDPSFAGTAVGETVGEEMETVDMLPALLSATAMLRLTLQEATLAALELPLSQLIGSSVRVDRLVEDTPEASDEVDEGEPLPEDDLAEEPLDEEAAAEARLTAALADVLVPVPVGPIVLRLTAADRVMTTPPIELAVLDRLELQVDVEVPMGSGVHARIPFGADPRASLAIVFASGSMTRAHLRERTAPLFAALSELSSAEIAALEAWTVRPRDRSLLPPVGPALEAEPPVPMIEAGDPEHPATALHIAALRSWRALEKDGLDAIAAALLVAGDRLRPQSPAYQGPARMAAVHWTPPATESEGRLTVWMSDPLRLAGLERDQRSATTSAYGLLRSALTGQVLNRVADRPPVTAFDVTLRAVGTGGRLQWWLNSDDSPDRWPPVAQTAAQADLANGLLLAGLAQPVDRGGEVLHGWWGVLDESGQTLGRVLTPSGIAQAFVRFARPRDDRSLESVLATLHDLHAALRWLIGVAGDDGQALSSLLPGACAATPLVSDLLRAGAPPGTVAPAFEAFCATQP